MNANAPLGSHLEVVTDRKRAETILILTARLDEVTDIVRVYFSSKQATECAEAFKRADRALTGTELGKIASHFSMLTLSTGMDIDIDTERGGIVLTVHVNSDEYCFLVRGATLINACADALLESASELRTFNFYS